MKNTVKKISICILLTLFASGQTLQAWPSLSQYLPKFSLSTPSFSSLNTKKVLIPLGAVAATGLAAYGLYKLWNWNKTSAPGLGLDAALPKNSSIKKGVLTRASRSKKSATTSADSLLSSSATPATTSIIRPEIIAAAAAASTPASTASSSSSSIPSSTSSTAPAISASALLKTTKPADADAPKATQDRDKQVDNDKLKQQEAEQARQEAKRKADEEKRKAKAKADAEANRKAEEERKAKEAEQKRLAELEAKKRAEAEAKRRADEQAERKAKEEAILAAQRAREAERLKAEQQRIAKQKAKEEAEATAPAPSPGVAAAVAAAAACTTQPTTSTAADNLLTLLRGNLESDEYRDDDQPQEEINSTAIELLKSYLNLIKNSFSIQNLKLKPLYLELYDKQIFKGSRNDYTINQLDKASSKEGYRRKLTQNYKIHLMPKDDDMVNVLSILLNDSELKEHICGIKIMYNLEKAETLDQIMPLMPRIVIYPASSKESAQKALNRVCKLFKGHEGLDKTPRYNQKVTSLIYYAQGDGQHKSNRQYRSYFENPDRVHYTSGFTLNGDYKLTFEEPARSLVVAAAVAAAANASYTSPSSSASVLSSTAPTSVSRPTSPKKTTWEVLDNGHVDPQQITVTHQAIKSASTTSNVVAFFVYTEDDIQSKKSLDDNQTYEAYRTFIENYQQIAYPTLTSAGLKFYGLCVPTKLKNSPDQLAPFVKGFSENAQKVIIIAFGESAEIINRISNGFGITIDTMIHLQPTFNKTECKPSNFRRLYNIYSREGVQPVRKYQQQAIANPEMPVKNIRVITAQKNGWNILNSISDWSTLLPEWANILPATQTALQAWVGDLPTTIADYPSQNFLSKTFIDQLPAVLDTIEQNYTLNFDLLVKIDTTPVPPEYESVSVEGFDASQSWSFVQETSPSNFKRPVVAINRFVELQNSNLYMHDGSKEYILGTGFSDLSQIKKQFTKEYQTSKTQLFDLMTNIVEKPLTWDTLNEFIQRYKNAETSSLYNRSDLRLNQKVTEQLSQLQSKLSNGTDAAQTFSTDFAKERIFDGAHVAQTLDTTNFKELERKQYLEKIVSFSWFLYSLALSKDQLFTEGAFVIRDPGFKIFNFLYGYIEKCGSTGEKGEISYNPFAYNRVSSHFKAELKENPANKHFGIDIRYTERSSALTTLPTGKRHILFAKLNNSDLLFVKFENYGIYAYDGFPQHGIEFIESVARKLGLTSTTDDADDYRKERIPSAFIKEFNRIVENHLAKDQRDSAKDLVKKKGIQILYHKTFKNDPNFDNLRTSYSAEKGYDHPEMRWGREVIVLPDDIRDLSSEITRLNPRAS